MALLQVALHWPPDLIKLFQMLFGVLFRTLILVSLLLFAYRMLRTAWAVLKFLVETLVQKVKKILTVDDPGVGPVSSPRG